MSSDERNSPEQDALLADVVERMAAELRRGQVVDLDSYTQRYPSLANRLRALYPALKVVSQLSETDARRANGQRRRE